jgi:hypothetical protein
MATYLSILYTYAMHLSDHMADYLRIHKSWKDACSDAIKQQGGNSNQIVSSKVAPWNCWLARLRSIKIRRTKKMVIDLHTTLYWINRAPSSSICMVVRALSSIPPARSSFLCVHACTRTYWISLHRVCQILMLEKKSCALALLPRPIYIWCRGKVYLVWDI